jgi:oligoribonuclease NrnB/cAMP/cGMP phosphodiesterase (DHH superfamily)
MSNAKPPIVIFHSPCLDGYTAAWACWLLHPDWEYVPGVYGQDPPDVTDRIVYLLDFSYKLPIMRELISRAERVVVLDHHATAEQDLKVLFSEPAPDGFMGGAISGRFDMEHSGAYMAWQWFHNEPVPLFVRYVEDRDMWWFKMPASRALSAVFFSYDYSFNTWSRLRWDVEDTEDIKTLVDMGEAIERKQTKDLAEMLPKLVRTETIGGYAVPCANLPYIFSSDAGHIMCQGERFAATYYVDKEGTKVYSLRSDEQGMDVSEIAKRYGGGGHKHAAGFRVKEGV